MTHVTHVIEHTWARARFRHDEVSRSFGKQIRDRRIQLGLSVNEAARLAGMSWSAWDNIEKGHSPTVLTWFKVAEVLGWELFIEVEEK